MLWPSSSSIICFKKVDKMQPHNYSQTLDHMHQVKIVYSFCLAARKTNTHVILFKKEP